MLEQRASRSLISPESTGACLAVSEICLKIQSICATLESKITDLIVRADCVEAPVHGPVTADSVRQNRRAGETRQRCCIGIDFEMRGIGALEVMIRQQLRSSDRFLVTGYMTRRDETLDRPVPLRPLMNEVDAAGVRRLSKN